MLDASSDRLTDHDVRDSAAASMSYAADREIATLQSGRDRRAFLRHRQEALHWVRLARLQFGQRVSLVDLSSGGARLEAPFALGPNSVAALELVGAGLETVVPFRVLRCEVGALTADGLIYRGACEFMRQLDLPDLPHHLGPSIGTTDVLELDLLLKHLVVRACTATGAERFSDAQVLHALRVLNARAAQVYSDPMGQRLSTLLSLVLPVVARGGGVADLLETIEGQIRRVVPRASLRVGARYGAIVSALDDGLMAAPGIGAPGPMVRIEVPGGAPLTEWQARVVRATTRVMAIVQRLAHSDGIDSGLVLPSTPIVASGIAPVVVRPAADATAATLPPASEASAVAAPDSCEPAAPSDAVAQEDEAAVMPNRWQKVVVRYADGEGLKGYTDDFHASRPHFTLRTSPSLTDDDGVIVTLLRLKAVFFVRDFGGNPAYVERNDIPHAERGRRIEVTLSDEEVIVGTTLNYRSDGLGFFVTPIDPQANNVRVFVVTNSVRHVRFPTVRQAVSA